MIMASPSLTLLLIAALTIGIFALDLVTPLGWADGFLYLVPLILILFRSPHHHHLVGFAALCSGLIILGWLFSPPGGAVGPVTYNRTMGIALLWVTALFLRHRKQVEEALRGARDELEERVQERTESLVQANQALRVQVAERLKVEGVLRESEERFRLIMEHANDAIFFLGLNGVVQWASRGATVLTGRTLNELLDRPFTAILAPASAAVAEARLATIRRGESVPPLVEFEMLRPDGNVVWVEANFTSVLEDGKVVGRLLVARDITERKRAERALRESQEQFSNAFGNASIGMALVGTDGRWLQVNRSLCEIVGYTEQELLATTFQAITHPDDLAIDLAYVRQMLEGAIQTYQMEKRYFHKQGHIVWILLSVSLVRDPQETPLYFIAQIQAITERKRAEEALRESEQRLSQLLEDRGRISRDLHDNIIQMLYAIGLGLEESQRLLGEDSKTASSNLSNAVKELNAVIRDVRSYIAWSEPKVSDGRQLKAAIERLARTMEGTHLLHFRLKVDQTAADRLTPEEASHVLYIAREAMSNSLRHSQARDGIVVLEARDGNICFVVADVGEGFDTTNTERYGQGLHNMAVRAQKLDARLQIISEPGLGVRIVLDIPKVKKHASA